jgi:transposase
VATLSVTTRHDLTDAQWRRLAPLLPAASGNGRPPKWTKRQLINGIRWRIRNGTPWRDIPAVYPPWPTVYGLFRRWQRTGVWDIVLAALQAHADAHGRICWDLSVDSMTSRAHQHAAGARRDGHLQKEPPGGVHTEPDDHGLGRSRGGLTTKTHLACEQGQKVMAFIVTAGQRGDSPQFIPVLRKIRVGRPGGGRPRTRPDVVLADKAYTSKGNRAYLRKRGIRACIPSKSDQNAHRKAKGLPGRPATRVRPGRLPATPRRRVRHQPPQTPPWRCHSIRQTRRPLPSSPDHHHHLRMALTCL